MTRKRWMFVLGLGVATGLCIAISWTFFHRGPDSESRKRELLSVRRLHARLAPYRFTPTYRRIANAINSDPVKQLEAKGERLENALYESGDLTYLGLWTPNLRQGGLMQVLNRLRPEIRNHPLGINRCHFTDNGTVSMLCPPELVTNVESAFCCITNRVPWGEIRKLAGSREDRDCRLPDGSMVDLDTCWKWLNDSVTAGWMVGVTFQSDRPGHAVIVANRKRPQANP